MLSAQNFNVAQLFDFFSFFEDKLTVEDFKDLIYKLITETTPVDVEHVEQEKGMWRVTPNGDTWSVAELEESDF
jgi:hypothetical protein